jgi:hypothetical protein
LPNVSLSPEISPATPAPGATDAAGAARSSDAPGGVPRGAPLRGAGVYIAFLGPGAAWVLAVALCLVLRERVAFVEAAIWGLLVLASFVAWGAAFSLALGRRERRGWGFHGTVGMGLALFVGGVFSALHLVSIGFVVVFLALGPFAWGTLAARLDDAPRSWLAALRRATSFKRGPLLVYGAILAVFSGVMLLQYLGSVTFPTFNTWDDNMAYREFVRQFLDTGTLREAFSYRRIGTYGGQSYLQALVLALSDRDRLHILDNGICALLMFGLAVGFRTGNSWARRIAVLAGALLAATLPHTPANLGSELSGLVFFLALFRLFDEEGFEDAAPRSNAILAGLLAASVCTLRQNYFAAAFTLIGFTYAGLIASPGGRSRRDWVRQAGLSYAALGVFLLPWMLLALSSVGTMMYPVFKGNLRPDFGLLGSVTPAEELRWSIENIFYPTRPIRAIYLMFAAALVLPMTRRNRAVHAFLFCNAFSFALMMHFFRAFADANSIARYYLSFTIAFAFAAIQRALAGLVWGRGLVRAIPGVGLAMFAVIYQLATTGDVLQHRLTDDTDLAEAVFNHRGPAIGPLPIQDFYTRLQSSVPAHAPLLVMLDHTYLLDFRRNAISDYDHPGVMGPGPKPPSFQGPEAWAAYMLSQGIRYVAFQIGPSSSEYKLSAWTARAAIVIDHTGRNGFYKIQARFELDAFATLDALTKSRKNLFNEGEFHVLDLATRA